MLFFKKIFHELTIYQSQLKDIISTNIREIGENFNIGTFFLILFIAFVYGVLHAIGPGHGKALISSYLLQGKEHRYGKAIKIGYFISLIHTLSAVIITIPMYYFFNMIVSRNFEKPYEAMLKISGSLIIISGLYLIYEIYLDKKEDSERKIFKHKNKDLMFAFIIGIIPCPGVMSVLFFSILLKKVYIGIIAAMGISIGMGTTITAIGILTLYFRNRKFMNKSIVPKILNIVSIFFIFTFGIILILS
ncbi:MAG: nickel transporter [Candidatus Delongbacteria bacterium]|nr:nickel transporter [Candidatus Delongbacteria bacterium]